MLPVRDPPKLPLVIVGGLHVVVGTFNVVEVVEGGIWLLGSNISMMRNSSGQPEGDDGAK